MSLDLSLFQFFMLLWFTSKFILPLSPGEISGDTILILSPNSERDLTANCNTYGQWTCWRELIWH
jgi:hypothetical protein